MSKEKRDFILFLEDIRQAVEKLESYTKNLTFEEFRTGSMAIDAVIRKLIKRCSIRSAGSICLIGSNK